jgi:hypothetical protein
VFKDSRMFGNVGPMPKGEFYPAGFDNHSSWCVRVDKCIQFLRSSLQEALNRRGNRGDLEHV